MQTIRTFADAYSFWIVGVVAGLAVVFLLPNWLVRDFTPALKDKLEIREQIRGSLLAMLSAIVIVLTLMHAITESARNQRNFAEQQIAKQFSEAASLIADDDKQLGVVAGFFSLGDLVRLKPEFRDRVFETIALYIRQKSAEWCPKHWAEPKFRISAGMQAAVRVFADEARAADPNRRHFKLEDSCLIGADLFRAKGLENAYMSGSVVRSADFREANLKGADFRGAEAADICTPGWDGYDWVKTNFDGADLSEARFNDAGLQGASFRGANLSKADLRGAAIDGADFRSQWAADKITLIKKTEITADQLLSVSCVGEDFLADDVVRNEVLKRKKEQKIECKQPAARCRNGVEGIVRRSAN